MTISNTLARNDYSGSTSTGPYVYAFKITTATDIQVIKRSSAGVETTLAYLTDYTVSGAGNDAGGSVTLLSSPLSTDTITVRRRFPITQPASLRNQGSYFPETIEDQLDRAVLIQQQQEDAIERSLKLPPTYNPSGRAKHLVPTAGYVVVGDGTGFTTAATSTASAVTLPGNSRTVSTLSAYLANNAVVNVKDYGAVGDGVTDDTNAIKAAVAAVQVAGAHKLVFPFTAAGYKITDTISFAAWNSYFTPYEVDFGGSIILANGLANKPAIKFYNNELTVAKNLKLTGDRSSGSVGVLIDSLQPGGVDGFSFSDAFVSGFDICLDVGSLPNNRVAFGTFSRLFLDSCLVGMRCNGLVDKSSIHEINTSACAKAGFQLSAAGAVVFHNPTAYGDYPLFLIDGAVGELTITNPQSESPGVTGAAEWSAATTYSIGDKVIGPDSLYYVAILGGINHTPPNVTYWSLYTTWSSVTAYAVGATAVYNGVIYTAKAAGTNQTPSLASAYWSQNMTVYRTASGGGDGAARSMTISGGTVNADIVLGAPSAGSAGGGFQATLIGCVLGGKLMVNFQDYFVTLVNVTRRATTGGDVTIAGAGSRVSAVGSNLRTLVASAAGAIFSLWDSTSSSYIPSGGAPATISSYKGGAASVLSSSLAAVGLSGGSVNVTYSASMTPDASLGNAQNITATNSTAFAINAPINAVGGDQRLVVKIKNTSGGVLGAVTFNAVYKMAAWTQPANGFSRSITFSLDGTSWVEIGRTAADVPN